MKMKSKTFPKLQIILIFFLFFLLSCQNERALTIDKEQFIKIYARLLIINEMSIKKEIRTNLIQKLYSTHKITPAEIDSTISYYNSNPTEWVAIFNRVREEIQEIRKAYQEKSSKKNNSLLSKSRKKLINDSLRRSFIGDKKGLIDRRKKSEDKKNNKIK